MLFLYVKMAVLYENVINLIFFCTMSLFGLLIKRKKVKEFWPGQELNSWPLAYKSDALSTELLGQASEMGKYNKRQLN